MLLCIAAESRSAWQRQPRTLHAIKLRTIAHGFGIHHQKLSESRNASPATAMPQAAAAGAEVPVPAAAPAPSSSCRPSAAPIPHNVNLRPACVADTAAAAAMFAAAFEEDPEIQYIYKGVKPHQYKPAVQMLYSKCTRMFFCRKGCPSWCAVDAATQVRWCCWQQLCTAAAAGAAVPTCHKSCSSR